MVTGGDTIAARKLYQESFEFKPAFKLLLVCNHVPKVNADDGAMWRRIVLIPMDHQVPKHLRDPKIKRQLTDPEVSGPAILQWLLKGCLDWQRDRLKIPTVVQQATDEYRASQDSFGDFVSDCCVLETDAWVSSEDLHEQYDSWLRKRGEGWVNGDSLKRSSVCEETATIWITSQKGTGGMRGWSGIRLERDKSSFDTSTTDSDSVQ